VKLPRLSEWYAIGLVLLILIWHFAPAQLPVLAYKLLLVSVAVVAGAVLERRFLPSTSNDTARAIVMAAVIIGLTLGI
jgi:hypothetical protein